MNFLRDNNIEKRRLEMLESYDLTNSKKELAFDRITDLAKQFFKTPIVAITFIGKDDQHLKSVIGLDIERAPREFAFCDYTIAQKSILIIEDTLLDMRSRHNPLVIGEPFIRFYAGVPIFMLDEEYGKVALGTLCLMDYQPHAPLTQEEQSTLQQFAEIVMDTLELRRQQMLAKHASQNKTDFLANISHEIRTPMNGILGMLNLLQNTALSTEQREYVNSIQASNQHLLTIVNDLLDLSKIEAGRMEFHPLPTDLYQLCRNTVYSYQGNAKENNLFLNLQIAKDLPQYIKIDFIRLRQILSNLVNNGIKFTKTGGVTAKISSYLRNQQTFLHIEVIDTGIGIKPNSLKAIFDAYRQAGSYTHQTYGGTGLGLSVCKLLAEGMGGSIHVHSIVNKGSTFHVHLPMELVDEMTFKEWEAKSLEEQIKSERLPAHVLLAEDNDVNATVAQRSLKKYGYEVTLAKNGQETVEIFSQSPDKYQIILMDHQMPILDGVQATQELKQRFETLPPIIAVTAHAMHGDRDIYIQAGMQDYCTKPYKPSDLDSLIQKWLHKTRIQVINSYG